MNENEVKHDTTKFQSAYNELNDGKKALLRLEFLAEFEHKAFDTFYKKKSGESPLKKLEKEWLAKWLNKTVEDLF